MRKGTVIIVTLVIILVLASVGSALLFLANGRSSPGGFTSSSLNAPMIIDDPAVQRTPHIATSVSPALEVKLAWSISPIYSGYGGVANVNITNIGTTSIYVYSFGLVWVDVSSGTWRDCSVLVPPAETKELGMLFFSAPSLSGGNYTINIRAEVQNIAGTGWNENLGGEDTWAKYATLKPALTYLNHTTDTNTVFYFNKVNKRVDYAATATLAHGILDNNSNQYNIQAVADAFDWVRDNIVYLDDPQDNWQSASETLALRTGDCEDQAMLLASIIGEMGGNARVVIIDQHAFPTIYVGKNGTDIRAISDAISSHYQTDLKVHFLSDRTGYWMIADTTGFPYLGGLPTLSGPVLNDADASWSFESSTWMIQLDATGVPASEGWLPFSVIASIRYW